MGIQTLPEPPRGQLGELKRAVVDAVERELIEQVLAQCGDVQVTAAKRLGINRNTLHKKLKDYNLDAGAE